MIEEIKSYTKSKVDNYEIFFTENNIDSYDFNKEGINFTNTKNSSSLTVRVFLDGSIGLATVDTLNKYKDCVETAIKIAKLNKKDEKFKSFAKPSKEYHKVKMDTKKLDDFQREDIQKFIKEILKQEMEITEANYLKGSVKRTIINSEGVEKEDTTAFNSLSAEFKDWDNSLGFGTSDLTPINIKEVHEWVERVKNLKGKKKVKSFKGNILFSEEAIGDLISNPLTFNLSGENVYYKKSKLNELDKEYFSKKLTIKDEPLDANRLSTRSFDSEGTACKNISLIENGKLKNQLFDSYYGNLLNHEGGNAFRTINSSPVIGLSNLTIEPGTKKDLIKEIDKGIYVRALMGVHTMDPVTSNFSLAVYEGFYVEKGEIKYPVKDCMVAGNLFELLNNITEISKDQKNTGDGWLLPKILCKGISVIGE